MIAVVIGAFVAGWLLQAVARVPAAALRTADRFVLAVALPALVFSRLSESSLGGEVVVPVAVAWSVMGVCAATVLVVARRAQWDDRTTGALLMVAVLGNTSFLGLGVVESLLGDSHGAAALAYDQPGTFLALATWGSWVASRYGSGVRGWRPVVRRLASFPPFLALVAALVLRPIDVPEPATDVMSAVGSTVAPVAMAAIGLRFSVSGVRRLQPVVTALTVKMLLAPAVVAAVAGAIGVWGQIAWQASIAQAAAPPMVTAGIVAVASGLDDEMTTSVVGWGTLLGLAWMPFVAVLV
ncbi:MAG: AEC family transporter [Ilumatobacteraceae bacterium]